jgi:hypothetical protein
LLTPEVAIRRATKPLHSFFVTFPHTPAMDDVLAEFVTEACESLAELDAALLKLEQAPGDTETLGFVCRVVQIHRSPR